MAVLLTLIIILMFLLVGLCFVATITEDEFWGMMVKIVGGVMVLAMVGVVILGMIA